MSKYIVVGAGVLGASAAFHLARMGADVTIVDRDDRGQATAAAAGIVCPWLSQRRNKAWYQLVKNGARYYPELIQQLEEIGETNTGYKQVGALSIHTDQEKLEKIVERARIKREEAPEIGEISLLTPSETKRLFPPLSEEYSSVFVSGGARVNGRALRDALLNGAKKLGATYLSGDAVLSTENGKITGVKIGEQTISSEKVLIAAGAWARELLTPLGVNLEITYQKAQIIHLEWQNQNTGQWPVIMPPNDQYMLAFEEGRIVIGATHEDDTGLDTRVTAGGMNEILEKALAVAPGLAHCTYLETRVGFRPFTPGFLPIIGDVPDVKGLLVANGLGASGLTSGPFLGAELARLALGRKTELDVNHYSINEAIK
ncbi:NAD(P)/FAD-dependent oxidoreductase [Bacillus pinisoli]|uniref:NAD(P)/FAD-dependent oxidoreductase n=1 Tax=Bacillus pinisoli TaxID=2901866 RepID=UPI001FF21775|nr:FAD-binding oxidoreductase [Bacillus pinisoli]